MTKVSSFLKSLFYKKFKIYRIKFKQDYYFSPGRVTEKVQDQTNNKKKASKYILEAVFSDAYPSGMNIGPVC